MLWGEGRTENALWPRQVEGVCELERKRAENVRQIVRFKLKKSLESVRKEMIRRMRIVNSLKFNFV